MANSWIKIFDYIFVLRPTLFFPVWTVFLANYHANTIFEMKAESFVQSNSPLLSGMLIVILMGSSFILNQLADMETDRENEKLFIIARGHISKPVAIIEAVLLLIISLIAASLIDYKLGLIFLIVYFLTGIAYNFKPFSWKNKPVHGIVANFLGGVSVAIAGWVSAGVTTWKFLIHALPYAFGLVAVYLLTTLADIKGDGVANKLTFGVKYGFKKSAAFAIGFEMLAIMSAIWTKDYVILVPAILSFPFYILVFKSQELKHALLTVKLSVLFATLAVVIVYPYYFIVIIVTYYFARWYYKNRFNLEYPRFAA